MQPRSFSTRVRGRPAPVYLPGLTEGVTGVVDGDQNRFVSLAIVRKHAHGLSADPCWGPHHVEGAQEALPSVRNSGRAAIF